jgi:quinol monooxygenase YgiN
MNNNLLTVVAELLAKPGKEDELRRELLAVVEPTRKEEGCVEYYIHVATDEPGRFIFYENWASREALDRHMATPHLARLLAIAGDLLSEPPRIVTYTRIA